ncbi:hypothetical protein, partial [Klebsiella pneumoniae]|uniref:hypothetical protein n=1 Tax=Klebsiella pneumoniae TaxID=573 RepID=UPI0030133D86
KLLNDIGFKIRVTLDDILSAIQVWRIAQIPFMASISQMSKLYMYISKEMATSNRKIKDNLTSGAFIFVPYSYGSTSEDVVSGAFLSPQD